MFGLAETMKQGSGGWQSELSQERALYPESGTSEATQQPLHTVEPGKSAHGTAVTWRKGRKRLTKKSLESRLIVSWRIHGSITFCFQGSRKFWQLSLRAIWEVGKSRAAFHTMPLFLEDSWLGSRAAIPKSLEWEPQCPHF